MMSQIYFFVLAFVTVCRSQDITSLMFQAMEMDAPPLPPRMPSSLRQHLNPQGQQQLLNLHGQRLRQQERHLAEFMAAQRKSNMKQNPYSISYSNGVRSDTGEGNLINSPANAIRQPGVVSNSVNIKDNPYTVTVKNPYSTSRQETSNVSGIRKTVSSLPSDRRSAELRKTLQVYQKISLLPKKIKDAKIAGCKLPIDSTAASVLMFNTCQSQAAQLICQSEMMQCNTVGMTAMCCPVGMNNLAMDTISYVDKLEKYAAEIN
ncbi:hypothetical protein RRG08_023446 [Elysia crispata]|uniref:Uncharacterized protein n=1 Tax=Elysia crispata TaxID=231223 RepID=A0AAE1ADV3_9GAST|nr:hypothetical protein RRG08_023446 [Elysia crispata]